LQPLPDEYEYDSLPVTDLQHALHESTFLPLAAHIDVAFLFSAPQHPLAPQARPPSAIATHTALSRAIVIACSSRGHKPAPGRPD
jgi:hypothetical protein